MKHYTDGKLPYFDSSHLSDPSNSYVAWLDVMGTRAVMSRSLSMSATFICKLHVTAIEAAVGKNIRLYPVMDGLYVVANTRALISGFLETVFSRLADVFINESAQHHRFIVKAAIAYGPIIHGSDIGANASWSLDEHAEYKRSILLGMPMVQAYQSETKAPPFGVFIHESARAFSPPSDKGFPFLWWLWFGKKKWQSLAPALGDALAKYFDWCECNSLAIEYNEDRLGFHRKMASQYFQSTTAIDNHSTSVAADEL